MVIFIAIKYNIGQRVKVVDSPPQDSEHPYIYWDRDMNELCGKLFTIKHIDYAGDVYHFVEDERGWARSAEWFKPADTEMNSFLKWHGVSYE